MNPDPTCRHKQKAADRQAGFALAAVLWLLAGLTILAAMIGQSGLTLAQRQQLLKQRADAELNFLSSRSEALFWLSTSRVTQNGIGWGAQQLKLDGRGYAVAGNSIMQVQDIRGLIGLNHPNRIRLGRLLQRCGASGEQVDSLLDALEDYTEQGNLKRLNGAKAFEYSMAGMPPPRLALLLSEPEIWRVFGWESIRKDWEEKRCFEDVTVRSEKAFNVSTATPGALLANGITSEQVAQLLKERETGAATLTTAVQDAQEKGFMGLAVGSWPAREFRVTHSVPEMPLVFRYELKLTTEKAGAPWQISAPRRLPKTSVIIPDGQAEWPRIDQLSETDKNALTQPVLPF